jgi:hypothetical protein
VLKSARFSLQPARGALRLTACAQQLEELHTRKPAWHDDVAEYEIYCRALALPKLRRFGTGARDRNSIAVPFQYSPQYQTHRWIVLDEQNALAMRRRVAALALRARPLQRRRSI